MIPLDTVFSLLTNAVGSMPALELVNSLRKLGDLVEGPYTGTPFDEDLPKFDQGYRLVGVREKEMITLEVLEKDSRILQAGSMWLYQRKLFSSKVKRAEVMLNALAEQHYGPGTPIQYSGALMMNYGDQRTICYVASIKSIDSDTLSLKIGNREYWDAWR
ncbi:hypothetical protein ACFL45_09535 [Candidatus Neomarinimicrobiota bacterium]